MHTPLTELFQAQQLQSTKETTYDHIENEGKLIHSVDFHAGIGPSQVLLRERIPRGI